MVGLLIRHGQAAELVRELTWAPLVAVYTSPLERAVETAHPLANDHGLDVHVRPALTDVDFGESPGGEALADVQRRVVDELMTLAKSHQGETIAIVTHAEPIRCALAALTGQTLDDVLSIEIFPARVSAVGITHSGVLQVLGVNLPPSEVTV
jgi:probable phosphoglycerate mutase